MQQNIRNDMIKLINPWDILQAFKVQNDSFTRYPHMSKEDDQYTNPILNIFKYTCYLCQTVGLVDLHGLPACINKYTHFKVWTEIIYPFLNFNGATAEV